MGMGMVFCVRTSMERRGKVILNNCTRTRAGVGDGDGNRNGKS